MSSSRPDSLEVPSAGVTDERYDVGELLGRGGMADVHRAHDRLLGRDVALKVLRDDLPPETSARERFEREARLLAGLSHPHVVTVLDAGFTGDRPYLVMELVDGHTLAQRIAEQPLDPGTTRAVGAQLADALAHAHARGLVHRDVKPANVLLDAAGRVRLADFGIARLVDDATRHTRTGTAIGTAAYLAPEQVVGEPVTGAADVYSLGLVLLEALTGARAFPGSTAESGLARLHRDPDVPDDLPGGLRDLLREMTARDPGRRPGAADVARRLRSADADGGVTSTRVLPQAPPAEPRSAQPRPAPLDVARGFADRAVHRLRALPHQTQVVLAAVAALAILVLLVGLLGGGSNGGTDPGDQPPQDAPRELRQPLQDLHDAVNGS